MKAATVGVLIGAVVLTGCVQKNDVDKCVDTWEASVKDVPDDDQKRLGRYGQTTLTKAQARYQVRLECMIAAGKNNE